MVVVLEGTAQPRFALGDRLPELVKVGVGQLAQWPPGLDQQRIATSEAMPVRGRTE